MYRWTGNPREKEHVITTAIYQLIFYTESYLETTEARFTQSGIQ
jgi:hypothetical protein